MPYLIRCPTCEMKVADDCKKCPYCGGSVTRESASMAGISRGMRAQRGLEPEVWKALGVVTLVGGILFYLFIWWTGILEIAMNFDWARGRPRGD